MIVAVDYDGVNVRSYIFVYRSTTDIVMKMDGVL